ncbi:hypothetical protein F5887DRAFT_1060699 [Amanita rubescens]|nr:hypothetical protein F5887DRAFT_1060699 [Amanita rubescens]
MEKFTRKLHKRWSGYARDHSDLGAALNGLSLLNDSDEMAFAIEKTRQAVDATYISTTKLLQELGQNWAEPLHECFQFTSIIKKLLAYRHQKHVQFEMTQDGLESKREQLEDWGGAKRRCRDWKRRWGGTSLFPNTTTETAESQHATAPSYLPPHPGPNPVRRRTRAPGMGFLNVLLTRVVIAAVSRPQLEEALLLSAADLKYSIRADLDRFQR